MIESEVIGRRLIVEKENKRKDSREKIKGRYKSMQKLFVIQRGMLVFLTMFGIWMGEYICTEASSMPELSVSYDGVINIMEKEASPQNVNKEITDNKGQITSSNNEIFLEEDNAVNLRIRVNEILSEDGEQNIFRPEDVKVELYQIAYDDSGGGEKKKLIEEMQLEQIEPTKELDENQEEREKIFGCTIKNLKEGHYKIEVSYRSSQSQDLGDVKSVEKLTAKDIETANCIKDGYYESPLFTIDTKEPVITEISGNQNVVRTIEKRQYFQEAPKVIIRIQEENFNRQNFSMDGKMFYADGKIISKEWERLKKQVQKLNWESYYKDGVRINEASMNLDTEANYTLRFQSLDIVGHKSNRINTEITYDNKKPEIIYTGLDNLTGDLIFKSEGNIDDINDNLLKFRKYQFFRYFCPQRIRVFVRARDAISGVEKINYTFIPYDKDNKNNDVSNNIADNGNLFVKKTETRGEQNINNRGLSEMLLSISPEQKDFKGYLKVYAEDYGRNIGTEVTSKGMVSESVQLHKKCSDIEFKMPKPFFADKEKGVSYYNKEVLVSASFEDNCSGIYKTGLYAGKSIGDTNMWDGEKLVYKKEQRITLKPEDFSQSSAQSPVVVQGMLEDNAGHVDRKQIDNKIVIDAVKPVIKVIYDSYHKTKSDNETDYYNDKKGSDNKADYYNDKKRSDNKADYYNDEIRSDNETHYYNISRKATVVVKEQNFNPKAVKWNIQGSNQSYRIGNWKTVQDEHMCEVYFEEDGENYAINLSVTDYAGNTSEWKDKGSFTIDRTVPKISIKLYDAAKSEDDSKTKNIFKRKVISKSRDIKLGAEYKQGNSNIFGLEVTSKIDNVLSKFKNEESGLQDEAKNTKYFNRNQVAVFCIQDRNFDKDKVEYNITVLDEKQELDIVTPTKYIKEGQNYYSKLLLKKEAKYHIAVKCTDKAGNESKTAKTQEFIIDKTVPQVKISGVENHGIYQEETIMPQVLCKDKHLDVDSIKVRLCRADGSEISKEEWDYEKTNYQGTDSKIDVQRTNETNVSSLNINNQDTNKVGGNILNINNQSVDKEYVSNLDESNINIDNNIVKIQWKNLENKKSNDGIYQLFIEAADKAGNKLKDNYKIDFRVNRWGADFIFGDSVKKEVDRHYLKESPQLILKEQCVKETNSRAIILRDNEERKTLEKENIKQHIISDKTSSRYGWYEKIYTVGKENFAEEGDYRVSFQADSNEEKIRFVVDRTPPVIKLGNLEDEVYEEEEHIFTVSIMDNYAFKKLELYIEESGGVGKAKEVKKKIIRPADLDENYTVREKLIKSGNKQTIRYVAWDKAGNKIDSEENGDTRRCYVTTNKALKNYYRHNTKTEDKNEVSKAGKVRNGVLLVVSMAGIASVAIVGIYIVHAGKQKKSEKQKI